MLARQLVHPAQLVTVTDPSSPPAGCHAQCGHVDVFMLLSSSLELDEVVTGPAAGKAVMEAAAAAGHRNGKEPREFEAVAGIRGGLAAAVEFDLGELCTCSGLLE